MKQLKKALKEAGFSPTKPKQPEQQWMVLHLPSAQYIVFKRVKKPYTYKKLAAAKPQIALFTHKARAGKAVDYVCGRTRIAKQGYYLAIPVPRTQLSMACFEYVLVEDSDKDTSKSPDISEES